MILALGKTLIIKILKESGYKEALLGISLSYGKSLNYVINNKVDVKLAKLEGGHNKFLESIFIWIDITAPRFVWSEMDTFRLTTKQSESTIHTLGKRHLEQTDFEYDISPKILNYINDLIDKKVSLPHLKNILPEGFLQRRIWVMNYKVLRNIISQRKSHKLPQWRQFCGYMISNVEHFLYLEDLWA